MLEVIHLGGSNEVIKSRVVKVNVSFSFKEKSYLLIHKTKEAALQKVVNYMLDN